MAKKKAGKKAPVKKPRKAIPPALDYEPCLAFYSMVEAVESTLRKLAKHAGAPDGGPLPTWFQYKDGSILHVEYKVWTSEKAFEKDQKEKL